MRAQQQYHDEKQSFSNNINDLAVVVTSEYYDFQIVQADFTKAIVTANAKENGLRSYAGIVEKRGYNDYATQICETTSSATSIQPPIDAETCGSGSAHHSKYRGRL